MFEVKIVEVVTTWLDVFTSLGPIFISVAVGIIAALQWRTSAASVKISQAVADIGERQQASAEAAVKLAERKREDELFDRRLMVFEAWVELLSETIDTKLLTWESIAKFDKDGGRQGRFLFGAELSNDLRLTHQFAVKFFEPMVNFSTELQAQQFLDFEDEKQLIPRMARRLDIF